MLIQDKLKYDDCVENYVCRGQRSHFENVVVGVDRRLRVLLKVKSETKL